MFTCKFAAQIQEFLNQKINGGAIYAESGNILRGFDRYVAEHFPNEETITRAIFDGWLTSITHLHNNTINRRIPVIRHLSRYLAGICPATYVVPGGVSLRTIPYQVHLITKKELGAFFGALSNYCRASVSSPGSYRRLVIPVVFRMLYATGMRSCEALHLRRDDVDLKTGKVVIRESKSHKMRVLFMHPELTALCRDYDGRMDKLCPDREPFFCNQAGGCWNSQAIWFWFRNIWHQLPEAREQKGNPFTPHSFRHNFALTVLNRWHREGRDLNVMLPYLAEYMGHSSLEALNYYLHLNEEFRPEIGKALKDTNDLILPEVRDGGK